jgi:hypothetical protein
MMKLALAAAIAVTLSAGAAAAQEVVLMAMLDGAHEKPTAGDPKGTGMAMLKLDPSSGKICYELTAKDLTDIKMAHIHKAPPGAGGPVAVPLKAPASGTVNDCTTADPAVAKDIAANPGDYYVNVHTGAFPAGAIRGQLAR